MASTFVPFSRLAGEDPCMHTRVIRRYLHEAVPDADVLYAAEEIKQREGDLLPDRLVVVGDVFRLVNPIRW